MVGLMLSGKKTALSKSSIPTTDEFGPISPSWSTTRISILKVLKGGWKIGKTEGRKCNKY